LVNAGTPVVTILGKSWDLHVHRALNISENENLQLITDTVKYLKAHGKEVVYDAEHFFDGYVNNRDFALRTIEAAKTAGADVLCLCDTNGGMLPNRLAEVCADVRSRFDGVLGIHTHNDCELGVANALAAIEQGFAHVQGCMNGYGERCGNANLTTIIANLELKMDHTTIGKERLAHLTAAARFIAELANLPMRGDQAYVGHSAFAHKGGVHVSAVLKDSTTYEHISPKIVGNRQRVLLSDLSGRGSVLYKLKQHGLEDRLDDAARRDLLDRMKQLEFQGYELEAAEGTFELLVREALRPGQQFFEVVSYETTSKSNGTTAATVTLKAQDGIHSATASGNGPVNALDLALRQCLSSLYPAIAGVTLTDYKVRVLDFRKGTAARVRVLIEWSDHRKSWSTVGVSENVIEASWLALVDALRLELMRISEQDSDVSRAVEDYCWGV
jgi:2-isopropylmalate synthase